jgi:hypothetical protein
VTTIYLIRHGQAEAGWSTQRDPGWATDDERVLCCQPIQGSRTTLERGGESFRVVEVGAQGASTVLQSGYASKVTGGSDPSGSNPNTRP